MSKHYRVGLIGCGRVAAGHANAYTAIESTELIAAAEPDPEHRLKFDETYGIVGLYENYREMLANEELDIISICTWPPLHCEMTVAAAESGVQAILCEKPMALNLGEADRMLEACEEAGTKLVIGHQHRFDSQTVNAIELIKGNAIGTLQSIFGYCNSSDLLTNGTHVVDLIRYFVDDTPIGWVMDRLTVHPIRLTLDIALNITPLGIGSLKTASMQYSRRANSRQPAMPSNSAAPQDSSASTHPKAVSCKSSPKMENLTFPLKRSAPNKRRWKN